MNFDMICKEKAYHQWCYLIEAMPDVDASIIYMPRLFRYPYIASQLLYNNVRDGVKDMLDIVKQAEITTHERSKVRQ